MEATCETCRWFDLGADGAYSHCRRYPPMLTPEGGDSRNYNSAFPQVSNLDFCGEHAPRKHATGGEG